MFKIDISDIWLKRFIVCWDFFPKVPHFISFTFWAGAVWENSFFTAEVEIPMHFCPWTNSITHVKVKYWHFPLQNNVIFQTCLVKKNPKMLRRQPQETGQTDDSGDQLYNLLCLMFCQLWRRRKSTLENALGHPSGRGPPLGRLKTQADKAR